MAPAALQKPAPRSPGTAASRCTAAGPWAEKPRFLFPRDWRPLQTGPRVVSALYQFPAPSHLCGGLSSGVPGQQGRSRSSPRASED